MKYKFSLNPYKQKDMHDKFYGLDLHVLAREEWALNGMNWDGWTPEEIQKIIDKSKGLEENVMYKYQVAYSDLVIYIYSDEVYFHDAYSEQEEADLIWSFEQFIDFMEQFKVFVAENS
ncbi:hypothetical protein [Flavobacterium sp. HSC-61S13]|uniref:hypothetical protein n=1 Tax=Flavobacterium sp. HSC-61S13 TaxID=2910963 RepID=UPI00209CF364|nr:hypothetical protein [Flavobacterium sp. HSC-61S13]MCP1995290.1 hypothetical protein [Flavobacterium sp. HSC-61S13]